MARSKGSSSSEEAKNISKELSMIEDTEYKYNFDYLRLIELLICYRIAESVSSFSDDTDIEDRKVTVEIPLIGDLTISPRWFHTQHRLTNEPSIHLDFDFTPSSGFKSDIMKAYTTKSTPITDVFSNIYGNRLKDLYSRLRSGE